MMATKKRIKKKKGNLPYGATRAQLEAFLECVSWGGRVNAKGKALLETYGGRNPELIQLARHVVWLKKRISSDFAKSLLGNKRKHLGNIVIS